MGKVRALLFILIFCASLIPAPGAQAATLSVTPGSGSYAVGNTFSVGVNVNTQGQAMNAASGVVSFSRDRLDVVSVSKSGSIFGLWAQEPSYSNAAGTVSFEGIVLNPGYNGSGGRLVTITFRAKSAGSASVSLSSGSVLANDGAATNILNGMGGASFTITEAAPAQEESAPETAPEESQQQPQATSGTLSITSATHPDQAAWYTDRNPEFSWNLPAGTLEVRTIISSSATANPSVQYIPPISGRRVEGLEDGSYYFAVQARTAVGWGSVVRYRVNVDAATPEPFSISFPDGAETFNPSPVMAFAAQDATSGIRYYEVSVGDGAPARMEPNAEGRYTLPSQEPGVHTVSVTAFDAAGNTTTSSAQLTIRAIDSPIITYYTDVVGSDEVAKVRGTTYPNSEVTLYIRKGETLVGQESVRSDGAGNFALTLSTRLGWGEHTLTARVTNSEGARSYETEPVTIHVRIDFLKDIVGTGLNYVSAILLIALIIGGLAIGGTYLWYTFIRTLRSIRREAKEAEVTVQKSFTILRSDIADHVARLERAQTRRKLSREEIAFLKRFQEELRAAQDVITKEVKDVSGKPRGRRKKTQ